MRTSTAYFVGAGTVIAAIVGGLGGGLLMANIVSPHSSNHSTEMTKLEQRMSTRPIPVIAGPSEPVPYLTATQPAATNPVVAAAPAENQPQQTQTEPANTTQAAAQPAEPAVAPAAQAPARARAASSEAEDSSAKVRDVDMKRAGAEKSRADRRQQGAERRRYQQRQEQELRDVEQKVGEQTEPTQAFEPVKLDMPRIRLF